jgi:hypothetical protein
VSRPCIVSLFLFVADLCPLPYVNGNAMVNLWSGNELVLVL